MHDWVCCVPTTTICTIIIPYACRDSSICPRCSVYGGFDNALACRNSHVPELWAGIMRAIQDLIREIIGQRDTTVRKQSRNSKLETRLRRHHITAIEAPKKNTLSCVNNTKNQQVAVGASQLPGNGQDSEVTDFCCAVSNAAMWVLLSYGGPGDPNCCFFGASFSLTPVS